MGRIATYFLLLQNFLLLLAPLFFLMDLRSSVDPRAPNGGLLYLLSDPGSILALSDLVAVLGTVILASALFLVILGLLRADRRVSFDAILAGAACLVCLVAWVPIMLYAQARARGTVGTLDAAVAAGGWTMASLLLLVAALAYLVFTLRIDNGSRPLRLTALWWPVYAGASLVGAAAIAGFFGGGAENVNAFSLGLTLKISLVPMLGLWAYRDLRDRWPLWAHLPLLLPRAGGGRTGAADARGRARPSRRAPGPRAVRPVRRARIVRPAPPPPDD